MKNGVDEIFFLPSRFFAQLSLASVLLRRHRPRHDRLAGDIYLLLEHHQCRPARPRERNEIILLYCICNHLAS